MGPYERFQRNQAMSRRLSGFGASGGPGTGSGLPVVGGGLALPAGIPAQAGGSIVQGDGFYYTYNIAAAVALAAAAVSTITLQFDQVTVFKWVRSTVYADIAGAVQSESTRVLPLVTLKITDTGSGMSFMNAAIPIFDIAGAGELPYVLPTPQFILANAVLQFTFTNISAATSYANLSFHMHGYKLYNYNQGNSNQ